MVMDLVYVQKGKNGEQSSMRSKVTKKYTVVKLLRVKMLMITILFFEKEKCNVILSHLVLN